MKKSTLIFIGILFASISYSQIDNHGNPIFNSTELGKEDFKEYTITSNYYTIKNNIDNKNSSVFVSESPSLKEYLIFARDLPSYFFIIHKDEKVFFMLMLMQKNEESKTSYFYNLINPNNNTSMEIPCNIWGEITENRMTELNDLAIDSESKKINFPGGEAYLFNKIAYRIQPFELIKAEVNEISKQLMSSDTNKKKRKSNK